MFSNACDIFYAHYYALTPFHDSTLSFAAKVHMHSHLDHSQCIVLTPMCVIILVSLDLLVNCHVYLILFSRDSF